MTTTLRNKLIIGCTILAMVACGAVATSAMAQSSVQPEARSALALLQAPTTTVDILPSTIDLKALGDGTIDQASIRSLGKDLAANYWVGVDESDNVCILVELIPATNSASACVEVSIFQTRGLSVGVYGPGNAPVHTEAYLFPDGIKVLNAPSSIVRVSDNLFAGDSRALESGFPLKTTGGTANQGFEMRLFGHVDLLPVEAGTDGK